MQRYKQDIDRYSSIAEEFSQQVIGLVINVVVDKTGNLDLDHFTKESYHLRDSILYRLSSLGWHIYTLCNNHVKYEKQFKSDPGNHNINNAKHALCFIFDDLIFNLISLHDYFANLVAFTLIGEDKKHIKWNRLVNTAWGKQNSFSKLDIAKDITDHEKNWVSKIQDFRAEIIHYNLNTGKDKRVVSWSKGQDVQYKLLYSIPEKLAKKLNLNSIAHEDVGIDLQHGSIEIADRSVKWLSGLAEKLRLQHTKNTIKRVQPSVPEDPSTARVR